VRGVTGDHEPTPTHRLGDETAEPQQGAVEDRSLFELEPVIAVDPSLQLIPNLLVRPDLDVLLDWALEVQPLDLLGALTDERESPLGVRVDQLRRVER
jgi:hypothetical protein